MQDELAQSESYMLDERRGFMVSFGAQGMAIIVEDWRMPVIGDEEDIGFVQCSKLFIGL
jgi:hypothetical protein